MVVRRGIDPVQQVGHHDSQMKVLRAARPCACEIERWFIGTVRFHFATPVDEAAMAPRECRMEASVALRPLSGAAGSIAV